MKNNRLLIIAILLLFCSNSCEEYESTEDKVRRASEEFCDCLETKKMEDCEKELNRNHSSEVNDSEFYRIFNSVNDCGVTIHKL